MSLRKKMKDLKADTIREDGRLERTCTHGVGHTVGHTGNNYRNLDKNWFWLHGCDGCCVGWPTEMPEPTEAEASVEAT